MSTETETREKITIKMPSNYKAVMINDSVTPIEFVMSVLIAVFDKNEYEATGLVRQIHGEGRAIVYSGSLEVVRQKVDDCNKLSKEYGFPLKVIKEQA
jgi:ATP-dependent Clp protease adaptor protein ClpS